MLRSKFPQVTFRRFIFAILTASKSKPYLPKPHTYFCQTKNDDEYDKTARNI